MSKAIGVIVNGKVTWHAPGCVGDYDTLCGIDADDPHETVAHGGIVEAKRGQKITCLTCCSIWRSVQALKLREQDFAISD